MPEPQSVRLATRASPLALTQARLVARALEGARPGLTVEIVEVRTAGDRGAHAGDKSRWVAEIEDLLIDGDADAAVHSAKDVPGELRDGLAIVAVPERADPRDSLCGKARSLAELAPGAVVGISSLRRRAALLAARPDLSVEDLRGNVDTRLARLAEGSYDTIVLAQAGLARLGRHEGTPLAVEQMTPAPGQGCLVLEARVDRKDVRELAAGVQDASAATCLWAERAAVVALGATCHTPVGAHARLRESRLTLSAFAGLPDGSEWVRDQLEGDARDPVALGRTVAQRLRSAGAGELLAAAARA